MTNKQSEDVKEHTLLESPWLLVCTSYFIFWFLFQYWETGWKSCSIQRLDWKMLKISIKPWVTTAHISIFLFFHQAKACEWKCTQVLGKYFKDPISFWPFAAEVLQHYGDINGRCWIAAFLCSACLWANGEQILFPSAQDSTITITKPCAA